MNVRTQVSAADDHFFMDLPTKYIKEFIFFKTMHNGKYIKGYCTCVLYVAQATEYCES